MEMNLTAKDEDPLQGLYASATGTTKASTSLKSDEGFRYQGPTRCSPGQTVSEGNWTQEKSSIIASAICPIEGADIIIFPLNPALADSSKLQEGSFPLRVQVNVLSVCGAKGTKTNLRRTYNACSGQIRIDEGFHDDNMPWFAGPNSGGFRFDVIYEKKRDGHNRIHGDYGETKTLSNDHTFPKGKLDCPPKEVKWNCVLNLERKWQKSSMT